MATKKTKNEETSELATTEKTETGIQKSDFGESAGKGFENGMTARDIAIPFFTLCQAKSAAFEKDLVPNLRPGHYYNSVAMESLGSEFTFLLCHRSPRFFARWRKREAGGGFRGRYAADDRFVLDALKKNGGSAIKLTVPSEETPGLMDDLVETIHWTGIKLDKDGKTFDEGDMGIIPFWSTKLGVEQKIWTNITNWVRKFPVGKEKPSLWSLRFVLKSKDELRKGQTNKQYLIELFGGPSTTFKSLELVTPESHPKLFAAGEQLHDMVAAGTATAAYESVQEGPTEGGDQGPSGDEY